MWHYSTNYADSEFNKVFKVNDYLHSGRSIIHVNEVDGTGKINYCSSTFLYHKDTWKYDADLIKDGITKTAPCFVIDVDVKDEKHPDLLTAQKYAIAIIERLIDNYGINPKYLYIFFSGKKGFHIEIPEEWFGKFIPAKDLHITFMKIFKGMGIEQYGVDKKMYYPAQNYRCINAQNYNKDKKEVLHKIQISYDELCGDIENILELAKKTRKFTSINLSEIKPSEALKLLYHTNISSGEETAVNTPLPPQKSASENHARIDELMQGAVDGNRNESRSELVSLLRLSGGHTQPQAEYRISEMNGRCNPPEVDDDEIQATINKHYSYPVQYLPPNSYWKFWKHNPFVKGLSPTEYNWYHWLCQKAYEKDGIYQKHGNSYNIYENQVVYTNIEWEGHTKIPQSTCYDIMKRLEKRHPQPFESKVMKYQKVNKKTGELTYHDAFTKITHYIFNHNYFREEEKNEYTIKT